MKSKRLVYGRQREISKLEEIVKSEKSEFVAVYGRRRVGKTFLIKEYFDYTFDFHITGLANADTGQQLFNFDTTINTQSNLVFNESSENWLIAFKRLIEHLELKKEAGKKIIFIDELPWFDTRSSDFMMALEHFWNGWATNRRDIVLIVCGSAASWMINELINNAGGLHNRVTQKMKIQAFTLKEAEEMLKAKNEAFDRYQILQLYMALGGIPYYLEAVRPGLSATQNIQELCFDKSGLLRNEFGNLYRSLFKKHELYEQLVETLSTKTIGLNRREIIAISKMKSGGTLTKILSDLEESGFIRSYPSYSGNQKDLIYRLSDYYTFFYFKFLKKNGAQSENFWINMADSPEVKAWQGFTFEQICLDHVSQIKVALGISGIQTYEASWRGKSDDRSAQVDLLIDRKDQVINLCECKFSLGNYTINKENSEKIKSKITTFKDVTKTKKAIFFTMITTYGVNRNNYSDVLVQNEVTMDALFA
ncbi:MAG: AAA family ATPase [Saprospiraceae bacterium]|nr:AAA family ATPase [Saprospiraceae bacterium]